MFLHPDPFLLEPLAHSLLQRGQGFTDTPALVVLEDLPTIIQRTNHEAETLLVADLDVTVPPPSLPPYPTQDAAFRFGGNSVARTRSINATTSSIELIE